MHIERSIGGAEHVIYTFHCPLDSNYRQASLLACLTLFVCVWPWPRECFPSACSSM